MKKILLVLGCVLLLGIPSAWSRPPSEITLTYDPQTKILHIDAAHVTSNPRKHFIRRISVTVNDQTPVEFDYVTQTSASHQIQDMTLDAAPGDVIKVLAVCNSAGRKEETLVVPQPADVKK